MSIQRIDGWTVDVQGEESRVLDLEVAERAGLARTRDVRAVIERNREELSAHGELRVCGSQPRSSGGRPGSEYWLNEDQAVALVALMRTPQARQLRIALVKLFGLMRRGQLPPAATPPPLPLDVAHGIRVGDNSIAKADLREACAIAQRATGRSIQAIHGYLRQEYRVGSIWHIAMSALPIVLRQLNALSAGRLLLPTKGRVLHLAAANDRQPNLPGVA